MGFEEQSIREVHAAWISALNAGDLDLMLSLMADDVVFLGPGQMPSGRDRFPAGFSKAHRESRISCDSQLKEIVIAGDLAYTLCQDSLSLTPRAGGDTTNLSGHRITIYHQQPDGRWLVARDAHTLSPLAD